MDTVKNDNANLQDKNEDFVLEKSLFSDIFEKDIRRVFIYKKAERIAKAIRLIAPAFADSVSFRNRFDEMTIGLISASIRPPHIARRRLSQELLALSSLLSVLRAGGVLSQMNADLISREAKTLLNEIASYEEPRLSFEEAPTLPALARRASSLHASRPLRGGHLQTKGAGAIGTKRITGSAPGSQGRIKDRREAILSIIKDKKTVNIKDISVVLKNISEKTVQRELSSLVGSGVVQRQGERRWSTYSLA